MNTWLQIVLCLVMVSSGWSIAADNHWPQWRGPTGDGVMNTASIPVTWGPEKNIRWKKAIPGLGLATPAIWGNKMFILTAQSVGAAPTQGSDWMRKIEPDQVHKFQVLCLDKNTGETMWTQTAVTEKPHESTHGDASWASNSPVTDGKYLVASFGSRGVYCYDLNGKLKWKKNLGNMRTRNGFGEGSSPVIAGNLVIVNWDHEDASFIVALDVASGNTVWRQEREEPTSWSTPVIGEIDGKKQVIVSATNAMRGYDLASGEPIWWCSGMTMNTIPTPILKGDLFYAASGFRGSALMALNLKGAKGDISNSKHVLWKVEKDTPYVPSAILVKNRIYMMKSNRGIMTCVSAENGEVVYGPQRLEELKGIYASPVAVGDKIYWFGRDGHAVVMKAGDSFEVVAQNALDDKFDASPAIAGDALYLRGRKYLYCISNK